MALVVLLLFGALRRKKCDIVGARTITQGEERIKRSAISLTMRLVSQVGEGSSSVILRQQSQDLYPTFAVPCVSV